MYNQFQHRNPTDNLNRIKFQIPVDTYLLCKKLIRAAKAGKSRTVIVSRPSSITWSSFSLDTNTLMHVLNGNKNCGYIIAAWNCRRGS